MSNTNTNSNPNTNTNSNPNTMTIHRGLAELKLLDARIAKTIRNLNPTGIMQKDKLVNQFYKKEDFEAEAKSQYQSINDLIRRKERIKSAIVSANATTMVTVGSTTMSIADAINHKTIIEMKKNLIADLQQKHKRAKVEAEQRNSLVDDQAIRLAEAALQKDNVKINDGDAVAITEPYIERNKFTLVDPLDVENLIVELEEDVSDFNTEIDAVLSEINAITYITI